MSRTAKKNLERQSGCVAGQFARETDLHNLSSAGAWSEMESHPDTVAILELVEVVLVIDIGPRTVRRGKPSV